MKRKTSERRRRQSYEVTKCINSSISPQYRYRFYQLTVIFINIYFFFHLPAKSIFLLKHKAASPLYF